MTSNSKIHFHIRTHPCQRMSAELCFTAFAKPGSCGLPPVTEAFKSVAKLGGAAETIAVSADKVASAATKAADEMARDHGEKMKEGITSAGMYVGLGIAGIGVGIGAGIAFAGYVVANAIKAAQGK